MNVLLSENDSLDSAGSVVKPPAVVARSFSGPVGLLKVNPQKANPNVLGRDALSVVNAQSLRSSTRRRVDARLAEVRLQHIRREEELKLKALAAAQELRKLESEQIVLQAEKEVAEANILADATSSCDGELDDVAPPLEAGDKVGAFLLKLSLSDQVDGPDNSNRQQLVPHEERLTMGSPDGTKVKSKCTFSPEVGNHAEPAVRTSSTSRHPPGFPPPTCIPGTIVSPSFGVDAVNPARFSLGPVPSGMFHGPAVAPENLNPVNGHGVTSKVDVVEPPIHGPAITRERSQGRYGTDLGLPGESVHSLSDIAKMLVRCRGSEAVSEHSKFTGNPLDYFKFIRQVEDRILSLYAESDPAHALYLLLEATSGRAYKLISGCVMLSPEKGLREALHLLHKIFGSPEVAVRSFIDSVCCGDTLLNTEMGLEEFYSDLVNCKVVLEAAGAHNLLNAASTAERIFMRLPNALKEGFVKLALDRGFDMDVVPFDLFIEFVDYKHRLMCSRFGRLLQPSSYKPAARFKAAYKARANVVQSASDAVSKQLEREKPIPQVVFSCCDSLGHLISRCETFARLGVVARKEFAKQRHLCFNCLGKGHGVKNCPSRTRCRRCSRRHHSLLHQPSEVTGDEEATLCASKEDTTPGLPSNQASTSALSAASNTQVKTRLQVLPICVIDNITGTCKDTLALLDSGADCHLISEGLYTKLGLVGRPIHSEMQLANGGIESLETFSTDCTVRGVLEDNEFVLQNVRIVPRLPDLSSSRPSLEDVDGCPYLAGIEIPKVEADCVQLIIGIDSPALHTFSEIRQDGNSKLWASKSPLGWVLHGRDGTNGRDSRCSVNLLVDSQVTPALDSLCPCQFDYVDRACDPLVLCPSLDDERAEVQMRASCTYENGHYQIGIPWRDGCPDLPNNYPMALSRLKCLGKRSLADPELLAKYKEKVEDLI